MEQGADKRQNLRDHLKMSVLTMQLRPGADLDEGQLSEAFGLSRTPLREVFRELAGEGFLELRAKRGARVSEMSHNTLRDFFLAAPMVYGAILRLAARNALPHQVAELEQAQSTFRETLTGGNAADRALANNRFHEITGEMAGNIYLLPSFRRLLIDHARIGMTFYGAEPREQVGDTDKASDQHDQIIAAIAARDENRAADLAEAHWQLSRDQIAKFVMPSALDASLGELPARQAS